MTQAYVYVPYDCGYKQQLATVLDLGRFLDLVDLIVYYMYTHIDLIPTIHLVRAL